jgi:hypothetical protein
MAILVLPIAIDTLVTEALLVALWLHAFSWT